MNKPVAKLTALDGQWKQDAAEHPITLSFKDGGVSARAGCNGMFGPVSLEDGKLVSKQLASTLMMCAPEAMERDRALAAFLAAARGAVERRQADAASRRQDAEL